MSMLASLGGSHANNLTGTSFQHDMAILPQGRALHGVRLGGPGVTTLEFICHDGLRYQKNTRTNNLSRTYRVLYQMCLTKTNDERSGWSCDLIADYRFTELSIIKGF